MFWSNGIATLHHADARNIPLPDKSVHMCVTSPPYFGLRNYNLGGWEGGDAECEHQGKRVISGGNTPKQNSHKGSQGYSGDCIKCGAIQSPEGIGLEPTLAEHLENIVAMAREVRRVLRDDGVFFLNYGDAYSSGSGDLKNWKAGGGAPVKGIEDNRPDFGLPPKNLMGLPWRIAFALQDDGWILRSAIVWHKPNPMPESVRDRPTNAYEMVFLFSKQQRNYFYDGGRYSCSSTAPASDKPLQDIKISGMVRAGRHGTRLIG